MDLPGFIDVSVIDGSGVYALTLRGQVVYIGQSKKLVQRMQQHYRNRQDRLNRKLRPGWSKQKVIPFDGFQFMAVPIGKLDEVERNLIRKYRPRYNSQLVPRYEAVRLPIEVYAAVGLPCGGKVNVPPPKLPEGFVRRV